MIICFIFQLPVLDKMINHDSQLPDVFLKLDGERLSFPLVTDGLNLADLLLVLPLPKPALRDASHQSLLSHLKNSEEACQLLNTKEPTCISSLLDALDFTTVGFIELKEENSKGRSHNGEISQLLNRLIQKNPVVFDDSICDDVSPPLHMNSP